MKESLESRVVGLEETMGTLLRENRDLHSKVDKLQQDVSTLLGLVQDIAANRPPNMHRHSAPDNTTANIPKVHNEWCVRSVLAPKHKNAYYGTVGIMNYQRMQLHNNISCQDKIWGEFKVMGKH